MSIDAHADVLPRAFAEPALAMRSAVTGAVRRRARAPSARSR